MKRHRFDTLILLLLAFTIFMVKFPITEVGRHVEMYIILKHLPDSLSGIVKSLFERWPPPNGYNYRPLQLTVFPFLYFQLFNWQHQMWLTANLVISCFIPMLTYILAQLITKSRLAAFFSSLFLFSYYISNFSYTEAMQYDPDCLYIVFYLAALNSFIWGVNANSLKKSILGAIFFSLSLMSKEVCAMLPIVIVLYVVLFKEERLKELFHRLKSGLHPNARFRSVLKSLIKDEQSLLSHGSPFIIIWIIYIILRVVIPSLQGTFDTAVMRTHSFTINLDRFLETIGNIILCTVQMPFFVKITNDGSLKFFNVLRDGSISVLEIAVYTLFALTAVFFLIQIIHLNRIVIFGFTYFLVQIALYVFINAPSAPHHYNSAFIGPALIFGEMISTSYHKIKQYGLETKKWFNIPLDLTLGLLSILLLLHGVVGVKDYIRQYDYLSNKGGLWQNKTFEAIEKAIPKPDQRKSHTVFYIKNSEIMQNIGDFYYMCIKPAYYGKKNILITHSYNIQHLKRELAMFSRAETTIIVLEHVNMVTVKNVTNDKNIQIVQQYMN